MAWGSQAGSRSAPHTRVTPDKSRRASTAGRGIDAVGRVGKPPREEGNRVMSAILFDRERVDHLEDLPDRPERLNRSKLLWADVGRRSGESAAKIADAFELEDATRARLASSAGRAMFHDYGREMH